MISFLEFIREGANMHHGSANAPEKLLPKNPHKRSDVNLLDTLIGTHYASDPKMSDKFKEGNYGRKPENPGTLTARRPPRSQLVKIHGKHFDQTNIANHIISTVFSRPDAKPLFKRWAFSSNHAKTHEDAEKLYNDLASKGKVVSHLKNYDPHLHQGGIRGEVADKYVQIMQGQGKRGLVYTNTSPNETRDGVQGKQSYVIFDPSKLPHTRS